MDTCVVARRALIVLSILAVPGLTGCQTVAGFGRDVQRAGGWISGGAEGTETWVFGQQDQAAEAQNTNGSMSGNAAGAPDAPTSVVYFATGSADIPPDVMGEIRSIATASLSNSGDSSNNAFPQGADNSSVESTSGNSGERAYLMSQQSASTGEIPSAGNGSGQNTINVSRHSAPGFEVIGYTDTAGSAEYNVELSQRRAQAVADALVAQGVPRGSIDVQWRGEDELPVPTADGVPEAQNRRVSIEMTDR